MKKILLVLLCLSLVGCAVISKSKKLEKQATELQEAILKNDGEIKKLQGLLKKQELQLKEKDLKIEELRRKLSSFGVFD